MLMLHGFMDSGLSFRRTGKALGEGFSCWAPDARGHGHSGWVGAGGYYHFWDYMHDAVAILESLELGPCGLVGHSMGGSIATGLASAFPEHFRWLVLLEGMSPSFTEPLDGPGRLRRWHWGLRSHGSVEARRRSRNPFASVAEGASRIRRTNPFVSEDHALELADALSEPAEGEPEARVWRADPLHRTPSIKPVLRAELESMWAAISCPVLSLWGGAGRMEPPDLAERHALLADLRVAYVTGAGHNLHHDRPEAVADAIRWMAAGEDGPLPAGLTAEPDPI